MAARKVTLLRQITGRSLHADASIARRRRGGAVRRRGRRCTARRSWCSISTARSPTRPATSSATLGVLLRARRPRASAARGGARARRGRRAGADRARLCGERRPLAPERLELLFHDFLAHYRERIAVRDAAFSRAPRRRSTVSPRRASRSPSAPTSPRSSPMLLLERLGVAERFAAICGRDSFPFAQARSARADRDDRAGRRRSPRAP